MINGDVQISKFQISQGCFKYPALAGVSNFREFLTSFCTVRFARPAVSRSPKNSSVRHITPGTLATTRATPSGPSSLLNSFSRTLEPFGARRCCQYYQGLRIRSDWDDFRQSSISGKHPVTTGNPLGINPWFWSWVWELQSSVFPERVSEIILGA